MLIIFIKEYKINLIKSDNHNCLIAAINGCDCFLFFLTCLHPDNIIYFRFSDLCNLDNIIGRSHNNINESFLAYYNITLGIGLILHYDTWYYLGILIDRCCLHKVDNPLN